MIEHMCKLFLIHAYARVRNGNLHILVCGRRLDSNFSARIGKLPCIVGDGIYHEKCKRLIRLDYGISVFHHQFNVFQLEPHTSFFHNIEKRL